MSKRIIACVVPCLMLCTWISAFAQGGERGRGAAATQTTSPLPDNPQSLAHIDAAKKIANGDPVLMTPVNFFCAPVDYNKPGPELEAMKVFDNLYAIPSSPVQQTTVWAITTRDGIILIDSGQQGRTEATLAELQKVGLDPAKVKYILLGHGHGDHFAGAAYFQEHYGTKVGAAAKDWDLMWPANPPANRGNAGGQPPKHDLVLEEGKPVKLGEETVTVVEIPGHTPGSLAFIFEVRENGKKHVAGLYGGTILDQGRITTEGLKQYIQSVNHYLETAKKMKVDVEIQNHALFDDTPGRLARLKARKSGDPNPFLMTTDKYVKFWNIVSECIQADIARRPPARSN
jgi:metallo-beta-lactamase class B